jgi:hypothetical protein
MANAELDRSRPKANSTLASFRISRVGIGVNFYSEKSYDTTTEHYFWVNL